MMTSRGIALLFIGAIGLTSLSACDSFSVNKAKYEQFARDCQKATYEDRFWTEFATLDADTVAEAAKRVQDNGSYLSLSWKLIDDANPSMVNCRLKDNIVYSNRPGGFNWDVLDGDGRGKTYNGWDEVP